MFDLLTSLLARARSLFYDNSASGLSSDNVQDAIDELNTAIVASNELSEILANGNTTGANDIIVTAGQKITTDTIEPTTASGAIQVGETDIAGVQNIKDALNAIKIKLSAITDSYITNNLALGDTTPTAQLDIKGDLVLRPSEIYVMEATTGIIASRITANATIKVVGNSGNITITATPSIAPGVHGQRLKIMGTDDTDTVTFQDESTLAGSDLNLDGGVSFTLGKGDSIVLEYDSTDGKWYEETRSDVTYTA